MIQSLKIFAILLTGAFILSSCDSDIPVAELKVKYQKVNSAFIDIDGVSVHYIIEGKSDDTLPIVLIHGTSASLHTWDTLSSLLKANKKIIRFDLPAFGLTGPNRLNQYNFNFYNQFLDENEIFYEKALLYMSLWYINQGDVDKARELLDKIKTSKNCSQFDKANVDCILNNLLVKN